jgi:hypothetical protein
MICFYDSLATKNRTAHRVTLRHTAAFALVGWYLLIPLKGHLDAPMAYWEHYGSYDTAKECLKDQQHLFERTKLPNSKITHKQAEESECIATDDPRLKEK